MRLHDPTSAGRSSKGAGGHTSAAFVGGAAAPAPPPQPPAAAAAAAAAVAALGMTEDEMLKAAIAASLGRGVSVSSLLYVS